jgi:ABC-2 type transport system permease protein
MSVRLTLATTGRVLRQLRSDRRTLALVLVVPCVLMWLFSELFIDQPGKFDSLGPALLGVFPFVTMFLVTSVTMVRERTAGMVERLFTTPLGKADLVLGYALAFGALAVVQAGVTSAVSLGLLGMGAPTSIGVLLLLAVATAVLGAALGLGLSALATTEFQAVQFMPAVVIPQILLCGLITPTDRMADWMRLLSDVMPLTYAVDGMRRLVADTTGVAAAVWTDLLVVAAFAVAALALGALSLRRRTG